MVVTSLGEDALLVGVGSFYGWISYFSTLRLWVDSQRKIIFVEFKTMFAKGPS